MTDFTQTYASYVTVLYVEDEPVIRESLTRSLQRRVKTVHVACNGEEGVEAFKKVKPDIVVSDIRMPLKDGLQMSAEIKALSPHTPIIITTAFNDEDFFMRSIDVGIDTYVKKPVDLKRLTAAIEKCAESITQRRIILEKEEIIKEQYQIMRDEMAMAARLQHSLFPHEEQFQNNEQVDVSFILKPQSAVSGDFLILKEKKDDCFIILLCDVMGHGVASGLVTVQIKTIFDTLSETCSTPLEFLHGLRDNVSITSDSDMFYTAICAVLNYKTSQLHIISAGGIPFLYYDSEKQSAKTFLVDGGFPIGLFDEESPELQESVFDFKSGDILLLQTDGLSESVDKNNMHFDDVVSQKRCCSCITTDITAKELVHNLYKEGVRHVGKQNRFEDDITLIALKKR